MNIKEGTVIYLKDKYEDYYLTDSPHIMDHIDTRNTNHTLYQSTGFSGTSWVKDLEEHEFKVAEVDPLPKEYLNISNQEYMNLNHMQESDLYEATGVQVFNGKDYVESAYEEWNDFFSEDEEFPEYMEALGTPLHSIDLEKVYAGDIVNCEVIEVQSLEQLTEHIEEKLKDGYKQGNIHEYQNSNEYFHALSEEIGINETGELNQSILKVSNMPNRKEVENGYFKENELLKTLNRYQKLEEINATDYQLENISIVVYKTNDLSKPENEVFSALDYLQQHREAELEKLPYFKENQNNQTLIGAGAYYSNLFEYYNEKNPESTKIKEGTSFNEDESTIILDTGKYAYEYDHAVGNIDKINTYNGTIEKSFEADRSPESKEAVEKDVVSEIDGEMIRTQQKQALLEKQRMQRLQQRGIER